jgi:hypothetical protein
MDQSGNNNLTRAAARPAPSNFSENSESLRKFGVHRLGESPSFLMRDQVDRRQE